MRSRPWWSRTGVIGVGVVLAGALGAWQAARLADALGFGPGTAAGPEPRQARHPPRPAPAGARATAAGGWAAWAGPAPGEGSAGPGVAPPAVVPWRDARPAPRGLPPSLSTLILSGPAMPEDELAASERLAGEMRRLVSDLEFTPGLQEPPQQVVAAAPAPWRAPPEAAERPPPVIEAVSPATVPAAGGVEVIVRGRDLRAAQVMFGGAAGRIVASSPTEVTVVAPPSRTGRVRVALTNVDGTYALAPEPFTYAP